MFADAGFRNHTFRWNVISDAYWEPSQTSKMEFISINFLHKKLYLGWLTKFWIRFCIKQQKRITSNFYFLFTFWVRLSEGSFLLKKIISLDYSINKNILLTVGFNLQITVTTDSSYLFLEIFREYMHRIMWVQGNIWVLNLCFSQSVLYLVGKTKEN